MKIPETTPGAYYSNEENGQWQPNGVIIDSGVGGGGVGSGDAGIHRPPAYPLHIPRPPVPPPTGYVMGGNYPSTPYPPGGAPTDAFADYMWMENEEEFDMQHIIRSSARRYPRQRSSTRAERIRSGDMHAAIAGCMTYMNYMSYLRSRALYTRRLDRYYYNNNNNNDGYMGAYEYVYTTRPAIQQATKTSSPRPVMKQLEDEALMEQCIEAMLEDERRERENKPVENGHDQHYPTTNNGAPALSLEETVSRSKLNPLAAEFVPSRAWVPFDIEEIKDTPEPPTIEEPPQKSAEKPSIPEPETAVVENSIDQNQHKAEESSSTQDPPEVSAADVEPISEKPQEKRPKEVRKESKAQPVKVETKKPLKTEAKMKSKLVIVKSETKIPPKKKEVKVVMKVEEGTAVFVVPVAHSPMPHPIPTEVPTQATPSFKPINYAAAAKANKPKKPSPPSIDKLKPSQSSIDKVKPSQSSIDNAKSIDKTKSSPPSIDKTKQSAPAKTDKPKTMEKIDKREKTNVKQEKPVQRMNSNK